MANGQKGMTSSGIVVGQTPRSRKAQKTEQLKGNKVTMGKNVPRQIEGVVGDITIREITTVGLRAYVKTDSGWYDINAMVASFKMNWIAINLQNNWENETTFDFGTPQYAKDVQGFVHLRGAIQQSSGTVTDTMFTLPAGFRSPIDEIWRFVVKVTRPTSTTQLGMIKILNTGVVAATGSSAASTALMVLEGISFFAGKKAPSVGGGGEFETSDIGQGVVL